MHLSICFQKLQHYQFNKFKLLIWNIFNIWPLYLFLVLVLYLHELVLQWKPVNSIITSAPIVCKNSKEYVPHTKWAILKIKSVSTRRWFCIFQAIYFSSHNKLFLLLWKLIWVSWKIKGLAKLVFTYMKTNLASPFIFQNKIKSVLT